MEKLRELLNKFEPYIAKDGEHRDNLWYGVICGESAIFSKEIGIQKIISKQFGFIKWLVDNDKIDKDIVRKKAKYLVLTNGLKYYEWLIMELSIQDSPIEFLISILK